MLAYKPSPNSLRMYGERYLDSDAPTVDGLHRRVSGGKEDYYELMRDGLFLPNSPTLFNMGTKNGGTLSACFVFDIMDALLGDWPDGGCPMPFATSIAGTAFKAMAVAKAGGGVGYYLGNIREQGAEVKSTHKRACGPVTVLRWLNGLNALITQGGKRALAQMGVLPCWHKDIRKFIHVKDENPHELSSFNISVSWTNEWLKRIDFDRLFHDSGAYNTTNHEGGLWLEQCQSAWTSGCPGMLFWSTINAFNATPHLGDINATNPCGETPNLSDEPCNLGSLAISRFFKLVGRRWVFLWDEFKAAVRRAIRFVDDILDWNVFPHPDITAMALSTRKLGLGVMGYADALALLRIPYDTQDAVDWGTEMMSVLNETAADESRALADIKGPYPAYEAGSDETKKKFGRYRNSTRTSIAPTGTIAILADASSSIEPHYELEWERTTGEGIKLKERIQVWDRLDGFVPKTAQQVDWRWHVKHMAAFQGHTDLGVSKTINMPETATVKDVSDAYRMMWESGCKGGTIYRDNCRPEQVLRKSEPKSVYLADSGAPTEEELRDFVEKYSTDLHRYVVPSPAPVGRRKLPKERTGSTIKFSVGGTDGYLTPNTYPDGSLGEIFIELANDGSTLAGMTKSFAKTFSLSLQNGTPLADLVRLHKNSVFEPRGLTGDPDVPTCTSIPDYIVRKLEAKFLKPRSTSTVRVNEVVEHVFIGAETNRVFGGIGQFCPECSSELVRADACVKCSKPGCDYSKC